MRLLDCANSTLQRPEIVALLESRGIPVFVGAGSKLRYPTRGAIYVCLDAQYDDAVALLGDENHDVAEPVDVEAFWKKAPGTLPTILNWALAALALVIGIWILLAVTGFTSR